MKKTASILMTLALLCCLLTGVAAELPFEDDYAAINTAAGSVLMLLVYDNAQSDYIATGSGFVAFDSNTLITNYHVVEGGDLVLAESDEGEGYFLDEVLAADEELDLAILRFKAPSDLNPLPLNGQGDWLRGQPVVAIGSPKGLRNTVSKGDISALFVEDNLRYIQFTAPISNGSSGGALFDNTGKVIGITTSSLSESGQNLNFAIDIREAIQLYEQADGSALTPLSQLGTLQARTEQEDDIQPQAETSISDFTARQEGPDRALVSWSDSAPKGQQYFIGYKVEGNSYFTYQSTRETSLVIEDLIPGQTYRFFIAASLEGLHKPLLSTSLSLAEPLPYSERGARLITLALYDLLKDRQPQSPLQPGLVSISQDDMRAAMTDRQLSFVYRVALEQGEETSTGNCLYVFKTPEGFLYTGEFIYTYDKKPDAYTRRADMRGLLADVIEYEGTIPTGTWEAFVFHDGALLGKTSFRVTPSASQSGEQTGSEPARSTALLAIAREGQAQLFWSQVEGAAHYLVYRANTRDSHYFYLDQTTSTNFTDARVVSGRQYYYKVSAVVDGQATDIAPPAAVSIPRAGQQQEEEDTTTQIPLAIGDQAYLGDRDKPYINPDIVNISEDRTVSAFSLVFYCEDKDYNTLPFDKADQFVSIVSFTQTIQPGQTFNPGKISMSRYIGEVTHIYVAIDSVTLSDGSVIRIPRDERVFDSWTIKSP
ncbi:MAG: trypsin-like peptidase domain-containing protein [Christensenellales bacterium]|jgi:hypothetical protein